MSGERRIFAFLWKHIRPYKWFYLLMLLAPITSAFYPLAYNYVIKLFLNIMAVEGSPLTYQSVLWPITLFVGIQFTVDIIWRISNIAEWKSTPYVRRSILLQSYSYVQNHSYSFFQDNHTGAISSKIKVLLDGYDKFWTGIHYGLLSRILRIFINLIALLLINIYIGLFILIWHAIYIPVIYRLSTKMNELASDDAESRHGIIGQLSDQITNILSIFAFSAKRQEQRALELRITEDFIPKQIRLYRYSFKMQLISILLYTVMFVFILFFMIHLKIKNLISLGDFSFVFGLFLIISDDLWHATMSFKDFCRDMGDLHSALSIIASPQQNLDSPNSQPLIVRNPRIQFNNVCFSYNSKDYIFNNLNLAINPGDKIGIVGRSGAGKSTLINLLLRYFQYHAGDISIDSQNILDVTQDSLRENIAIIPQDTMLFHRTIMENVRFGKPTASDEEVIEACKQAHIHEYISKLPNLYNTYVGERGIKLSVGQRQRIAIARAILKNAPILVLDEATSALDSQTEQLIQDSLNSLIQDKNKTVIAIAHRLSTLKHMSRIIVLEKGCIIEEGTHDQLIVNNNSLYKKLWECQGI